MKARFTAWAALLAAVCLAGCTTAPAAPQHADAYESNLQVLAMPSCTAKMEQFCTCYFIASLKIGDVYYLPAAFEGFLQKKGDRQKPPR